MLLLKLTLAYGIGRRDSENSASANRFGPPETTYPSGQFELIPNILGQLLTKLWANTANEIIVGNSTLGNSGWVL